MWRSVRNTLYISPRASLDYIRTNPRYPGTTNSRPDIYDETAVNPTEHGRRQNAPFAALLMAKNNLVPFLLVVDVVAAQRPPFPVSFECLLDAYEKRLSDGQRCLLFRTRSHLKRAPALPLSHVNDKGKATKKRSNGRKRLGNKRSMHRTQCGRKREGAQLQRLSSDCMTNLAKCLSFFGKLTLAPEQCANQLSHLFGANCDSLFHCFLSFAFPFRYFMLRL